MVVTEDIKTIVKQYFNSAIIIDDEMYLDQQEEYEELTDEDLEELDIPYDAGMEISATIEKSSDKKTSSATETFYEFINEGFVTLPYKYSSNNDIKLLSNVIKNSKLMVLDWNLENTKVADQMGESAIQILKSFTQVERGLRCSIIYTREDLNDVRAKMEYSYNCEVVKEDEIIYFEDFNQHEGTSFFGFILTKNIQAEDIINEISKVLLNDKSITLHLMESANYLDQSLDKSIKQFNAPFEKVFFTQLLTSEVSDKEISSFINENLLSNVLETSYRNKELRPNNFLFINKKNRLLEKLNSEINCSDIQTLIAILNMNKQQKKIINLFLTEHKPKLIDVLSKSLCLDEFKDVLENVIKNDCEIEDKVSNLANSTLIFLMMFENFTDEEEFIQSFYEQSIHFTKILKFSPYEDYAVNTGSIIRQDDQTLLLCITPVCDTVRTHTIDNKLKFITGEIVAEVDSNQLKNASDKYFYMAVPIQDELIYVKWKFFNSLTLEVEKATNMKYINTLKKEYTQSIINRYIAYQSRAGIDEIFYKESNYINNFINLIKKP